MAIGQHGVGLIREVHERTGRPARVLTHCNAGWLATVDWGTALAPIYTADARSMSRLRFGSMKPGRATRAHF